MDLVILIGTLAHCWLFILFFTHITCKMYAGLTCYSVSLAFLCKCLLGWFGFWLYLYNEVFGFSFIALVHMIILIYLSIHWKNILLEIRRKEWGVQLCLIFLVSVLYSGQLFLFGGITSPFETAASRYVTGLPVDNKIPYIFAENILSGNLPNYIVGDWLHSDRPPMQTGVILLYLQLYKFVGNNPQLLGFQVGQFLQLWWIPACFLICKKLNLKLNGSYWILLVLALLPTQLINSNYTWPKLAAAAALISALVILLEKKIKFQIRLVLAYLLFATAWLLHGGVAFGILGLIPIGLCYFQYRKIRIILALSSILFIMIGPWWSFQKLYDPPANRLLKWHLAGVQEIDHRSFPESILNSYGTNNLATILDNKRQNFRYPFVYAFDWVKSLSAGNQVEERYKSFYFLFNSIGIILILSPITYVILVIRKLANRCETDLNIKFFNALLLWQCLTLTIWPIILFGPATTSIHQGSFTVPLLVGTLGAASIWIISRSLLKIAFILQLIIFIQTWLPDSNGEWLQSSWGYFTLMGIALLILIYLAQNLPHSDKRKDLDSQDN